jgi:MoxR-like ATPase
MHKGSLAVQHFAVIQSLCRLGLETQRPAIRQQVERLRDRLLKSGDIKDAETLNRLLSGSPQSGEMAPTKVEVSRFQVTGETLSEVVHPPVDRETAHPLCRIVLDPSRQAQRMILPVTTEKSVAELIEGWANHDRLAALGVTPGRSCLLFGPPGTGKTVTAYHIAASLRLPLIDARIDGLISSFLGTTARNIANLFSFANRYRCVLLLDEFDAIGKLRDDPQEVGEIKRVVNSLLQNLDMRADSGMTIAITNHDRLLDQAVWRRFENQIHFAMPDRLARQKLLAQFLKPLPASVPFQSLMAYVTHGRSGADLRRLSNNLKRFLALKRSEFTPPYQFRALVEVLAREPSAIKDRRAERLICDLEAFVTDALKDPEFDVKQKPLADLISKDQSTVSRWAKKVLASGAIHAQ